MLLKKLIPTKTFFIILCLIFSAGLYTFAQTYLNEPPLKYMTNLRTCTPTTIKDINNGVVHEYIISGKLPDGRCKVQISEYTNFADPQVYKDATTMMRAVAEGFGLQMKDSDIPPQAELIKQEEQNKTAKICKFTPEQRQALYNAYLKHDGKNTQGTVKRDKDGNITSFSGSFSMSNMSSYEHLMMNYSFGTCESI